MNVCIIPARGGSKRIPRKNIRDFCGKPMIARTIETARQSGLFESVLVTTDSDEIAAVAEEAGAEIQMRAAGLSDDHTTAETVFNRTLDRLRDDGLSIDRACLLFATAAFVQSAQLRRGLTCLDESGAAVALSVAEFPYPIFRALNVNENGRLEMFRPEHRETRTQDLPVAYYDAGQFCWVDTRLYSGVLCGPDSVPVLLPSWRVHDLDTPDDWHRAELVFQALENRGRPADL